VRIRPPVPPSGPDSRPRHGLARIVAFSLLALSLAACTPVSRVVTPDGPSGPIVSTPGPVLTVDGLVGSIADHDAATVDVAGFLLITGDEARLCSAALESYPPQCGGPSVRVLGDIPQDLLSSLDSTNQPDLAQATWGSVQISGTVQAVGADGEPTITIASIALSPQ
jgi:hypothetical protein